MPAALPRAALGRGFAAAGALAIVGGVAFWQLTAMAIAETSPAHGAGEAYFSFSFTTAAGPSASVAPLPGPTPAPTPTNPVPQP